MKLTESEIAECEKAIWETNFDANVRFANDLLKQLAASSPNPIKVTNLPTKDKSVCQHCGNPLCDAQRFNSTCFKCGKTPQENYRII